MSVNLCDVDVDVYLLAVDYVVPVLLVDADLDVGDVANFVSQHFLDADVDAIHDFSDSILDAHSNLDVDAKLIVVDFPVESSSTSARLAPTSLPPTSWTASEEHPQRSRHRVDPHELPDHLWRLPSTSALDLQPCQLYGCISRQQVPASQAVRHHAPRPHLQQGVTPLDLASSTPALASSSRPAASGSPRLASVCVVASPAATTAPIN